MYIKNIDKLTYFIIVGYIDDKFYGYKTTKQINFINTRFTNIFDKLILLFKDNRKEKVFYFLNKFNGNVKILAYITSFLDKSFYKSEKELNMVVNKINQEFLEQFNIKLFFENGKLFVKIPGNDLLLSSLNKNNLTLFGIENNIKF